MRLLLFPLFGALALYLILRAFVIWRNRSCQLCEAAVPLGVFPAILLCFVTKPVKGSAARLVAALYWFLGSLYLVFTVAGLFLGAFGELRGPAKGWADKIASMVSRGKAATVATVTPSPAPPPAPPPPSLTDSAPLGRAAIQQLSAGDYEAFVSHPGRVNVVDFHADWCGPCRVLGPVLERVVAGFGAQAGLGKVNVDHAQQLAAKAGVKAIPDVRIMVDGQVVDQFVGALPEEEIRARIQRQISRLPAPVATAGVPADPAKAAAAAPVNPIVPMEKDWLPPGIERRGKAQPK